MSIKGVGRSAPPPVTVPPQEKRFAPPVPRNTAASAVKPLATADLFEVKSARAARALDIPPAANGANLPAIQSNTQTVRAGTVTLDDATKEARGALKIEPGPDDQLDPRKYDGMYIGSDGYAYPPDKFSISEVPPFKPDQPVATPAPTTYYVNGILTKPQGDDNAPGEAQKLANKTGTNVVPIYNATEGLVEDVIQTGADRLAADGNKAADTLANAIYNDLQAGREVNVVGYSQGGAIVSNALREVDDRIKEDMGGFWGNLPIFGDDNRRKREELLGNINVTTFAGAGKTFPDGPSYNFYVNNQDPVPTWLGAHEFLPLQDIVTGLATIAFPWLGAANGGPSLQLPDGGQIHTFGSSGTNPEVFSMDGSHGINTYLSNIQDAVP
ncbi:hypothetical protein ACLESO_13765 [Pyxidicoccus sp. 3LG]